MVGLIFGTPPFCRRRAALWANTPSQCTFTSLPIGASFQDLAEFSSAFLGPDTFLQSSPSSFSINYRFLSASMEGIIDRHHIANPANGTTLPPQWGVIGHGGSDKTEHRRNKIDTTAASKTSCPRRKERYICTNNVKHATQHPNWARHAADPVCLPDIQWPFCHVTQGKGAM